MIKRPIPKETAQPRQGPTGLDAEDRGLVERVKNGETEIYGQLVQKYQERIFNTCWRICGHLEDARDLTQEAFLKAFQGIGQFRRESGFYTWIYRVAVNLALSHRRRTGLRRVLSLDAAGDSGGTQAEELVKRVRVQDGPDPQGKGTEAELQGAVAHALQGLDDEQRAVVVLRDLEGLDYLEIAVILEIPPGTVKSRLHRARLALRDAIEPLL